MWILCTSGSAISKAGLHCDAVSGSAVIMGNWSDEAEGEICATCHTDFVTNYSTLPIQIKKAAAQVTSSLIAMNLISYNTTGYLSREADTLMNLNNNIIIRNMAILKDKTNHKFS